MAVALAVAGTAVAAPPAWGAAASLERVAVDRCAGPAKLTAGSVLGTR